MEGTIQLQIGSLTEAVNTLKAEVQLLRKDVSELSRVRAIAGVVGSVGLVSIGAGITELMRVLLHG